jgi:hypothetical protein
MNRYLLNETLLEFTSFFEPYFINRIDVYYHEIYEWTSEYYFNEYWIGKVDLKGLNEKWQMIISNNEMTKEDVEYSIIYVNNELKQVRETIENHITICQENHPEYQLYSISRDSNFEMFESFFQSESYRLESENIDNINLNEVSNNIKFTKGQKFLILRELGLLESDSFKKSEKYTQESKQKILSDILGCDIRTAKGFINNDSKYLPNGENLNSVNEYLKRLKRK